VEPDHVEPYRSDSLHSVASPRISAQPHSHHCNFGQFSREDTSAQTESLGWKHGSRNDADKHNTVTIQVCCPPDPFIALDACVCPSGHLAPSVKVML
jgi:hypothetical protein